MKRKIRSSARALLAGALALLCWLAPTLAAAQEFQKVSGAVREELPAGRFVAAAYGFIWIAVLLYVVSIARGLGRVRKDLGDLKSKLDRAGPRP
ncbi:MAG TPA: CcmD family protein [Polyangia bacterium]|nr:CcmD family protein [Polyangia bacterium]